MSKSRFSPRDRDGARRTLLTHRAKQAIDLLMESNGHTKLTKPEFAGLLAQKYGNAWITNGRPNVALLREVCALTKDQECEGFEQVKSELAGFVIDYAPVTGGIALLNPSGELTLESALHMLSGDILRQQTAMTIHRRRVAIWKTAARSALNQMDYELGTLLSQIEHEINTTGLVSQHLVQEFLKALSKRGIDPWSDSE